jgi:hypothetical protein
MVYCDRGYGHPSGRPRVSHPATYCSSTPRMQNPLLARWHAHLHGLVTSIHEISGLGNIQHKPAPMITIAANLGPDLSTKALGYDQAGIDCR